MNQHSGSGLRAWRHEMNVSQEEFAEALIAHAAKLGIELRTTGNLVSRWERGSSTPSHEARHAVQSLTGVVLRSPSRTQVTSTELAAVAAEWVGSSVVRRVTVETVEYFERSLADQYVADNLLGPRSLFPVLRAHTRTIEGLLAQAPGPLMDRLLRVGAGYAEFTGWLAHDAGDLDTAAAWCNRGLEWAHACGDSRMAAFILVRRASQSISRRQPRYAVHLAQAAQQGSSSLTAPVRLIAALTQAHAHALLGEHAETQRALDQATVLLGSGPQAEGDPTAGRYCAPELYLSITKAKCFLELGHATDAVVQFQNVLNQLPADYHRDRGQYLARLTAAYLRADQPDQAYETAAQAWTIAAQTGSSRTLTDLRTTLNGHRACWQHLPVADRMQAMLTTHTAKSN